MKKLSCSLLALVLICSIAYAEIAYVTITDGESNICLADMATEVTDIDADGVLSVGDALYSAHEQYFDGGAAAGYSAEDQGYGLSLTKLWGIDNGGAYGYCLNNASCLSLADPIADGDHVHAYIYQDLENWSDAFSYFKQNEDGSLTLIMQGHDADWNTVESPVVGANITLNGEDSGLFTDENGSFTLELPQTPGRYTVSATYDDAVLVPPVCVIDTTETAR